MPTDTVLEAAEVRNPTLNRLTSGCCQSRAAGLDPAKTKPSSNICIFRVGNAHEVGEPDAADGVFVPGKSYVR